MKKDFSSWGSVKEHIHSTSATVFFKEREVWWCSVGVNIGNEQDGTGKRFDRPVLIIKKFNTELCWVIMLTSKVKIGNYYVSVGKILDRDATAVISQIKIIDKKRLIRKITTLNIEIFKHIKSKIINLMK